MIIDESVVKASLIPGKGSSEEIGALPDRRKDTLIIYKGTINTASFTSRMNPSVLVELSNYPLRNKGNFSAEASFRGN